MKSAWTHLSHVPLRADASDRAECVNELLAGEKAEVLDVGKGNWVLVELEDGYRGWMDQRQLRPVTQPWEGKSSCLSSMCSMWTGVSGGWLPAGAVVRKHNAKWFLGENEVFPAGGNPEFLPIEMADWAKTMLGVPYHWGGRSGWGFDCSGLVVLAAKLQGIAVPRDASQQFGFGTAITQAEMAKNDIVFFKNDRSNITHVGICLGENLIIHASGEVRIDKLEDENLLRHEDGIPSHELAGIRRWIS